MVGLLGKMHQAGVPIVAGTDGFGIEIVRELEIYVEAGLSTAQALAAATIVPARLVHQDGKTGSVKVGKTADLVLVDGDPSARIGDLRQTRVVMLDGKLLDADALRKAAGYRAGRSECSATRGPLNLDMRTEADSTWRLLGARALAVYTSQQYREGSIA